MNRRLLKGYVLIFLVLVLYTAVAVSFPKTVIFWIASGFSVPVFFAQIYTLHTIVRQDIEMKDRALDFPRLRISALYSIVQFAAGFLLMKFAASLSVFTAIVIEVGILLLAVVGFYAVEAACAEVSRQNATMRKKTAWMHELKERLNRLTLHCEQEEIRKRLRALADEMPFYHPASTDGSSAIENEITSLFTELEEVSLAGDENTVFAFCERMTGLLKERDRICKDRR